MQKYFNLSCLPRSCDNNMKNIHPFPARMAPEIALTSLNQLKRKSVILDPMSGSGTVLRQAVLNGHQAIGFDMDPLAVLLTGAASSRVNFEVLDRLRDILLVNARKAKVTQGMLPWIDNDPETKEFISYWFVNPQKAVLRKLAYALYKSRKLKSHPNEATILRVVFSRLIVTKHKGASLAWDVSHSRPHKVANTNDFDVFKEFERSYNFVKAVLKEQKITGKARAKLGDARKMSSIASESVDRVITSPPYLNAIDYLRGHKLTLVWLGFKISQIRTIRGESIGVEKGTASTLFKQETEKILKDLNLINKLPSRQSRMVERYILDACMLMKEVSRVLKPKGTAVFVVGNSCLKNVYIKNSEIFRKAAALNGLVLKKEPKERELPQSSRYLPVPKGRRTALGRRMRTEVVLEFRRSVRR